MSEIFKMCYDKIVPSDLRRLVRPEYSDGKARMALFMAKKWPNGSTLKVRFMGGTPEQHDIVKQFAPRWSDHANLRFDFNNAPDAEIRITFLDDGAWSYIGTDSLNIPLNTATMNFGWLDESVVLHEFGHAIGLIHEHQNPVGGIQWNRENVIRDLSGPPNNWPLETIEHNIFRKYNVNQMNATAVDKLSIMMYTIPQHWTLDDFHTESNNILSKIDKDFIGASINYPKDSPKEPIELTIVEMKAVEAEIGQPGEQDLYKFITVAAGRYTIETTGQTDVTMSLYGPDSQTTLIAEDDDSGTGRNAKIVVDLTVSGTYYVQIRHYNSAGGTGSYNIWVIK
ncbi:pre-peptidase C-terminal domain-containing protein [Nitrosomonas cryotolerans]|uniref:Pre-peptidase C-terminal domain-containing protein n=2 Tax=Nitrosomonas cryotolerans TaxID=44575 RepID=A0A1N6HVB9_9PROT|nr:pre-peptidase C-terminal domain-containing protein [Nitrosomonas cryotolerans]SFQ14391.1 pre-peptidase C-terminal domain-containing protein [Nitrosomonas cryotolerans]SIO23774.1 pre-peptidase C-terminal domain-containing protein [Nitrosomonas cryotolerans ATCC 49181]